MKKKFLVIALLAALLVWTVRRMMEVEEEIRRTHVIVRTVEDPSKPLTEYFNRDELTRIVRSIRPIFKTGRQYFLRRQVLSEGDTVYRPVFWRGINVGTAVPGKFPAEFSLTFDDYVNLFAEAERMHVNLIRLYTLLPPDFYKALAYYNVHRARNPLYLMQGIWAPLPPEDDYRNEVYTRRLKKEITEVIDALHGRAVLPERPGKASGVYAADVSEYVAGWLPGREWEPQAVFRTDQTHAQNSYHGDFISVYDATPTESWLAELLDFAARYETQTYRTQHPLSFVNWLPLDPMYHNTEFIENKKVREYDNDLSSVDFTKFHASELFPAGLYAAYHVYPYYPDFIFLDEKYRPRPDRVDNYAAYLQHLKARTAGMPLVIAEYGLPDSRGMSHYNPAGFHQGGHSEKEQAEKSLQLTRDIVESGCAGAVYFEWFDEWFKHNWLVMDFEIPFAHRKLWHNMENPEQNFGIRAMEGQKAVLDGEAREWSGRPLYDSSDLQVYASADAAYLNLGIFIPELDFGQHDFHIAVNTYDKRKGDHRLPFSSQVYDEGFEFLVNFHSPDSAEILVDEPYTVYTDIEHDYRPPYRSLPDTNGYFIPQLMLVNRGRESLTGEVFPPVIYNRSPLIFGRSDSAASSNADWYWNPRTHFLEVRLAWHLLNVTDPSHRYVLDDDPATPAPDARQTDGLRLRFFLTSSDGKLLKTYPPRESLFFTWPVWEEPSYTERPKALYDSLREYFGQLSQKEFREPSPPTITESVEIMPFRYGKEGALSVDFDFSSMSQYRYAVPLLKKYALKATFEYFPSYTRTAPVRTALPGDPSRMRMGTMQLEELREKGHGLAAGIFSPEEADKISALSANSVHVHYKADRLPDVGLFVRPSSYADSLSPPYSFRGVEFRILSAEGSLQEFYDRLKAGKGGWQIAIFRHIRKQNRTGTENGREGESAEIEYEKFRRQIRLMRNTDYWIAPEHEVFLYEYERKNARFHVSRTGKVISIRLEAPVYGHYDPVPLTLKFTSSASLLKIRTSSEERILQNRRGYVFFDLLPGKVAYIEILQ